MEEYSGSATGLPEAVLPAAQLQIRLEEGGQPKAGVQGADPAQKQPGRPSFRNFVKSAVQAVPFLAGYPNHKHRKLAARVCSSEAKRSVILHHAISKPTR